MKYNLKTIIYSFSMVLAAVFTGSCDKEESPFTGHDNHLVSFSITLPDGVKYAAAIQGTDLVMTVPVGVKLSGAVAEYALCENAVIVPNPSDVTEWDKEQIFMVSAYNSSYVSYKYKVNRSNVIENGSVTLSTQAEVDAFAKQGISSIGGNLIIGNMIEPSTAYDTIKNVDALSGLQEVALNIIVNNTYRGKNLAGLANLKNAGGLYVGNKNNQAVLAPGFEVSFPVLERAGSIVLVSDSITTVSFPKLKTVGNNLYLNSRCLKELDLTSLVSCSGHLTVKGLSCGQSSPSETTTNNDLNKFSLPVLVTVGGDLYIDNLWKVALFEMPKLSQVNGDLSIVYVRIVERISFPALTKVEGNMQIQSNDGMKTFSAPLLKEAGSFSLAALNSYSINLKKIDLPVFERSNGHFTIKYAAMENLKIPALKKVKGTFTADNLLFLETLTVPLLEECGSLVLSNIKNLKTFDTGKAQRMENITLTECINMSSFKSPKVATGKVTISNSSSSVLKLPEIKGLDTIRGELKITANNFTELVLPPVKTIGRFVYSSGSYLTSVTIPATDSIGAFSLANLSKLTRFSAPVLKKTYSFNISGAILLQEIDLPVLESVEDVFKFYGGSYLSQAGQSKITNLNGFASLKSAGKVEVKFCGNLVDFTGLKNVINSVTASGWTVLNNKYNPTYQDMVDGKYIQ